MESEDRETYLTGVFDQLEAALTRADDEAVHRIIDSVDADGFPQTAAVIAAGMARTSLGDRIADEPGGTG